MIEFDCSHCGNHFRVEESLAGRHGWCRLCKGFIVVPTARSRSQWEDLPAEQRVVRLEKILRSTTELFNAQLEQLGELQQRFEEREAAIALTQSLEQHLEHIAPRLEQAERDITRLSYDLAQTAEAKGAAQSRAERAEQERAVLADTLAESKAVQEALAADLALAEQRLAALAPLEARCESLVTECVALQRRLAETESDMAHFHAERAADGTAGASTASDARHSEMAHLTLQLEAARAARDDALAQQGRVEAEVRQLEKRLAATAADASRWQVEAERLAKAEREVAVIQAKWDEAQAMLRQIQPGIAEAHEARGRAESVAGQAQAQASRLAEQVSRLTEDNEAQRASISGLRRDLEQARAAMQQAEGEAAAARDCVRRLETEVARLREAEVQAGMVAPLSEERDRFHDRLVEAEAQVMRLKEELASASREALVGAAPDAMMRERESLRSELERTQQAKADAERQVQGLVMELRQAQTRLDQVTAERNRLIEDVTGLQEKGARFDALISDLAHAQARLEESQRQVERLTERLAAASGYTPGMRGGAAGRLRGYDAPVIPPAGDRDLALIPEVLDDDGLVQSNELMASMLRFIEPRDGGK